MNKIQGMEAICILFILRINIYHTFGDFIMKKLFLATTVSLIIAQTSFAGTTEGLEMLDAGDVAGAAAEFQAAYEAGEGDGAFYLGRLFEVGAGTDADPMRAANLYAAGVEKGSVLAMNRLGVLYQEGKVLLRDYVESTRLFCQAADAGDANGEFNCGLGYQLGQGVEKDINKTVEYWEKAGAQGNVAALNLLGQIYIQGEDIDADPEKARVYFEQTADLGNAMGLQELAKYYGGLEVPDNVKAYSYANLAAVRGHPEAISYRDTLEKNMSQDEIAQGQAMAKAWTEEKISVAADGQ